MLRNVGGALLGYLTIFVLIIVALSGLWAVLGADGAFQPGSWEASNTWALTALAIGFVVALIGGWVTGRTGRDRNAVYILIGIMVVMTVASALGADSVGGARPTEISMADAMSNALSPSWFYWVNVVTGIAGVWIGAQKGGTSAVTTGA